MSEDKEGSKLIYKQMAAILKDIPAIPKDRKNTQQGYAFRGIDDVYIAVHDVLAKHKVVVLPMVIGDPRREERQTAKGGVLFYVTLTVKYTFFAEDGSNVCAITMGEAMDSGDKATNKAMSAAMKYALLQTFCIPTEGDNDTENESHTVKPKQTTAKPSQSKATKKKAEPKEPGRTPEEYLASIEKHFDLFADAYGDERASAELLSASEFQGKDGEMVSGYSSIEDMKAKAEARGLDKAAARLRVICHMIEASYKKALASE